MTFDFLCEVVRPPRPLADVRYLPTGKGLSAAWEVRLADLQATIAVDDSPRPGRRTLTVDGLALQGRIGAAARSAGQKDAQSDGRLRLSKRHRGS